MPVVTLANGTCFHAEQGATLLDAAKMQGLVLEHSCRNGRCGSCKAHMLSGGVKPGPDAVSLSADERDAGWILTCTDEAVSDLQLDIEDLGALAQISQKILPARIAALESLAVDVMRVELRLPPNAAFRFLPGQSIDVTSPEGVRRRYSLAGDMSAENLELHIRRVEGGQFSDYLFERARLNDLLRFHGPHGTFVARSLVGQHLIFLATGTGIAPIRSMLLQLAALPVAERPVSVALYWGGRKPADLYWDPRTALATLAYTPVVSRADDAWRGARGYVQDALLASNPALGDASVYACGSEAMVESARGRLIAAGLPRQRYFADAFVSSD